MTRTYCNFRSKVSNIERSQSVVRVLKYRLAGDIGGGNLVLNSEQAFKPKTILSTPGVGGKMVSVRNGEVIFGQGDVSDAVFVIWAGC